MTNDTTEKKGRGPGRPFQPGTSGNPGGRIRMDAVCKTKLRDVGPELIDTAIDIARDAEAKPSERLAAVTWLADRLWGKAPPSPEESDDAANKGSALMDAIAALAKAKQGAT